MSGGGLLKLLGATAAALTVVQGIGTALESATLNTLSPMFLGLNLTLVGVWLVFHELNPALAPFDLAKWVPFLQVHLGKAFVFQFVAFLSTGSYFGIIWNSFVFLWQLGVAGVYLYLHVAATHRVDPDSNHDSLLLHDYQKLDVHAM